MITVHHLGVSQSERIVWLCEELGVDYELKRYDRDPQTQMAPVDYKALHPMGIAPVITDGDLVLGESGAIIEYIIAKYGRGKLALAVNDPDFAAYLYWFHFSNGTIMPAGMLDIVVNMLGLDKDSGPMQALMARGNLAFQLVEDRLGEASYFTGEQFTAADIMMVFPLTTMRAFVGRGLEALPNIRAYLKRIGARPAYQKAMAVGDPGMKPMLD